MSAPETEADPGSLPEVSVVCAWYNRSAYLQASLDSLLAQSHDNFEIVLVDDGSTDPRLREILARYDDPRLRVIHQENAGFTRAIRRAIDASTGRYVALQGAGDISFSNRLARQAAFLDAHPDYAAVSCGYNNALIDRDKLHLPLPVDRPGFNGSGPKSGQLRLEVTPEMIMSRNPFTHGEVMIRRSAHDAVGGYRTFFANAQDKDLWLRLIAHHRLGVLEDWLYQRHTFAADGIATSLRKLLVQTAYSMVAERCWHQRQAGRQDDVDRYGALALMRVPMGPKTTRRVLRSVKQAEYYGTLDPADLVVVRDLYGPVHHVLSRLLLGYLSMRRKAPAETPRPARSNRVR